MLRILDEKSIEETEAAIAAGEITADYGDWIISRLIGRAIDHLDYDTPNTD